MLPNGLQPDGCTSPHGRLLWRLGLRGRPSPEQIAAQADAIVPAAVAHVAALMSRFCADIASS